MKLLSVCLALLSTGCATIMGIKEPKILTAYEILNEATVQNIPTSNVFILNNKYKEFVSQKDSLNSKYKNDLLQPLQYLIFDESGKFVSYNVNCYMPGFPNLNWNYNGIIDTFPAKHLISYPLMDEFKNFRSYIDPLDDSAINNETGNYKIIVYWNKFMRKQSMQLIEAIKYNLTKKNSKQKVDLYFVNVDNFYSTLR